MKSLGFLDPIMQDIRYSFRTIRKRPTFGLRVVLILAIGIGGNTAMFTVIRAVLLKPLEYRDRDRLVNLFLKDLHENKRDGAFSLERLEERKASAKSFSGTGAFLKLPENVSLSGDGEPEALEGARVDTTNTVNFSLQP